MKNFVLIIVWSVLALQPLISQTVTTFTFGDPDDAIALDSNGNIYAAGFIDGSIFKFTPDGTGSNFITGLENANGIDFDSSDNLYVNDWNANELLRYLIDGTLDDAITIPGNPSGMLKAIDNDDMIYTRYGANTINRITPDGVITQISDAPELNGPVGLAYDENGNLYVGNYNNREIYRVGTNGGLSYIATVGGSSNLGFIAFAQGRLWGTVLGEHKIYTINHNATDDVTLFAGSMAGSQDGPIAQATFNRPNGIRFNDDETILYVTDFGTKNLRVITEISLGVSSETFNATQIALYPNPSADILQVRSTGLLGSITIQLYSGDGKLLKEFATVESAATCIKAIDVSDLASGTYFITIRDSKGAVTKQWIKK